MRRENQFECVELLYADRKSIWVLSSCYMLTENQFGCCRVVTCGQTDRHGEANRRIFASFS
jgi:hypothetical protein